MKNRLCDIEGRALDLGYRTGRVQHQSLWVEKKNALPHETAWFVTDDDGAQARCIDTGSFTDEELLAIFTAWIRLPPQT